MAKFPAISVVSKAMLGLLDEACPRTEFDGPLQFSTLSGGETSRKPRDGMTRGLSLYLYRVAFNTTRRKPAAAGAIRRAGGFRPSTPLDLWYLLTAWSPDPDRTTAPARLGHSHARRKRPMFPAGFLESVSPRKHQEVFSSMEERRNWWANRSRFRTW